MNRNRSSAIITGLEMNAYAYSYVCLRAARNEINKRFYCQRTEPPTNHWNLQADCSWRDLANHESIRNPKMKNVCASVDNICRPVVNNVVEAYCVHRVDNMECDSVICLANGPARHTRRDACCVFEFSIGGWMKSIRLLLQLCACGKFSARKSKVRHNKWIVSSRTCRFS